MTSSRREFLLLASLSGAALLLRAHRAPPRERQPPFEPNLWLAVHEDGVVEFAVTRLEMGQGIRTGLTLLVAEELALAPAAIRLRTPSTAEVPDHGEILKTTGSISITEHWRPLRLAAAAAREMLVAAAAASWGVPPAECAVEGGRVVHPASGRSRGYGELIGDAARQPVPENPRLKPAEEFRWIGRPTPRLEGPDVVCGRPRYGADVRLDGQLYAALARPPAAGGVPRSHDAAAASAVPGVRGVVSLGAAVAVVAEDSWSALRGRDALAVEWDQGETGEFSSARFDAALAEALDVPATTKRYQRPERRPRAVVVRGEERDPRRALGGSPTLTAEYATGFQTHAPMEPLNATARWDGELCEIWCGHQVPHHVVEAAAEEFGVPPERIVVHPLAMGGGFGGREAPGFALEAARLARQLDGRPVQIVWSREDDLGHALFHPASRHRLEGWLDGSGRLAGWRHRVASPSVEVQWGFPLHSVPRAETSSAWNLPYVCAALRVEYADLPVPLRLGFWRSVSVHHNAFAVECFVDELAHRAGRDAVEFRIAHLGRSIRSLGSGRTPFDLARLRRTVELVAERGDWGAPLPPGRGRGLAAIVFDGRTAAATIAEVTVRDGELSVDRLVCALDCGVVVNPLGMTGNAESALAWGLSAMSSEITFARGRVVEISHLDYPILRLPQMPAVEIHAVPSAASPSGTGEIPAPTVAPAVANAVFQATGRRLRRLPLRSGDLA